MGPLFELITSPDRKTRDQGLELALALGPEALDSISARFFTEGWVTPSAAGLGRELLELLCSDGESSAIRSGIKALPPIALSDPAELARLAAFSSLEELTLVWPASAEELTEGLKALPSIRHLTVLLTQGGETLELPGHIVSLRVHTRRSVPVLYGSGLRALTLEGHFSLPPILTTLPRGLQVLRLPRDQLNPIDLAHFDRLEEARLPTDWSVRSLRLRQPLRRLHLGRCEGPVPSGPALGARTELRIDRWFRPTRSAAGDARIRWVGLGESDPRWPALLATLPNLEVLDPADTDVDVPAGRLPAPELLWERRATEDELRRWSQRGRAFAISVELPTESYIEMLRAARTLFGLGIRDAKVAVTAAREGRLCALGPREASAWVALFTSAGAWAQMRR